MSDEHPKRTSNIGIDDKRFVVMLDIATLIDTTSFDDVLSEVLAEPIGPYSRNPVGWRAVQAQLEDAPPAAGAVRLVERLEAAGWAYSVSCAWPTFIRRHVAAWLQWNVPTQPEQLLVFSKGLKAPAPSAAELRYRHCTDGGGREHPRPMVALFVAGSEDIADQLAERRVAAISAAELAALSDDEFGDLLEYSRRQRFKRWRAATPKRPAMKRREADEASERSDKTRT